MSKRQDQVEVFWRRDGQASHRIRSANGQIVSTAGEGYTRPYSARRAARRLANDIRIRLVDLTLTTKRPKRRAT